MSIPLKCPKCLSEFKAKDKLAGKRVKCPQCGQGISVPGSAPIQEQPRPFEPPKFQLPPFEPEPGFDDPHPGVAETAAAEIPEDEPAWSTPQWDDAEEERRRRRSGDAVPRGSGVVSASGRRVVGE